MPTLTLDQARTIIDAALNKGRETDCAPLAVVVLDGGGQLKAFMREDGAGILRFDVARGKAWGALALSSSSRALATVAAERPAFAAALSNMAEGKFVPAPGGVLIRSHGDIIGSVGISGDLSDKDEACAVAGIEGAGLTATV